MGATGAALALRLRRKNPDKGASAQPDFAETLQTGGPLRPHKTAIFQLLADSVASFMTESTLIRVDGGPVVIAGDIHGHLDDLDVIIDEWKRAPASTNLLFLGDYVDKGPHSLHALFRILSLKTASPDRVFVLRGNHESWLRKQTPLHKECLDISIHMPRLVQQLFDSLPLAAVVHSRYFCVHGGIGPELGSVSQIAAVNRPVSVPITGLICDLLWSDPGVDPGFPVNLDRGCSVLYGKREVERFLADNELQMIIRAHRMCTGGAEYELDGLVLTAYSSTDPHCRNQRAVVWIEEDGRSHSVRLYGTPPVDDILLTSISTNSVSGK